MTTQSKTGFQLPTDIVEVQDEYQLNLCHYEIQNLKPKGTLQFANDERELNFRFFTGKTRDEGIMARLEDPLSPGVRQILGRLESSEPPECLIQIMLLQFKLIILTRDYRIVKDSQHKAIHFKFPPRLLKMHRRKFIRIPFNEQFPAQLKFSTPGGDRICQVKDLSREGLRIIFKPEDAEFLVPGARMKLATLKILSREIHLGLQIIAQYPNQQLGLKIIAISEEDRTWLKDCIRLLVRQILQLPET